MQLFNSKSFRNSHHAPLPLSLLLFSVVFLLNLSRPTVEELQSALKSKSKQGMAALQAFASMDLSWARELMEGHEGKSQQQLAEDARYVLQCVAMCCNVLQCHPPHTQNDQRNPTVASCVPPLANRMDWMCTHRIRSMLSPVLVPLTVHRSPLAALHLALH